MRGKENNPSVIGNKFAERTLRLESMQANIFTMTIAESTRYSSLHTFHGHRERFYLGILFGSRFLFYFSCKVSVPIWSDTLQPSDIYSYAELMFFAFHLILLIVSANILECTEECYKRFETKLLSTDRCRWRTDDIVSGN